MKKVNGITRRIAAVLLAGALTAGAAAVPVFAAEDRGNTSEVSVEKMAKEAAKEAGAAKGAAKEAASQAEMEEAAESDTSAAESDASKEAATEEAAESINGQGFEKETESITDKGFGEEAETSGEESGNTADTREAEGNTATDAAAAGENAAGDVTAGDTSVSDAEENTADENTDTEDTELEEDTAGEMEADDAATGRDGHTEDSDDAAPSETDMENGTLQEKMITEPGDQETVLTDAMMSTVASGKCGTNLTWTLNDQGTLTISGTGKMNNYNYQGSPWYTERETIKTVIVKDGVTSIGTRAFDDCENLTTIKIGNGLKSIGTFAFHYCQSLRNITIPDSVTSIGGYAFYFCKSLKNITIPKSVTSINEWTFFYCKSLESITIPDSVKSFGHDTFSQCSSLKSIKIPNGVTSINNGTFAMCSSLSNITIPDSVTSIGEFAFSECSSFTSIKIPKNVKEIQGYAFNECGNLKKIEIPKSVSIIGEYAFYRCKNLAEVYYTGSQSQWNQIDIKNDNDPLLNAVIHYNWNVTQHFSDAVISGLSAKTYTGKALTPIPAVTIGVTRLTPNTDYTVSYSNNINAGTATVTITGKGRFSGTKTANFKINKASQPITVKSTAYTITVGKTATVSITGARGTKSFKSSDTSIAAVNAATGVVTGKKLGKVTITAASAATSNYYAASKTITITVGLPKPGSCRFNKWNNAQYSSCQIAWNKVEGADGYQSLLSWTDGSHAVTTSLKSNVLSQKCTVAVNHVSQFKVRAYKNISGSRVYGVWSNVEYITPSPTKLTTKNASSGSTLKMNINWNIIYGCNGYNVFLATNPNGTWYWNQSTSTKADATSAAITKFRGSNLKKNTRYYVRIVTRRQRNGVFCTVPMPASNTYIGSFIIK